MIEAGNIAVFINNVMVRIETEEGHDDIVEKVLRKIAENDLFVKPEKYVWKVREIRFFGVIIEPQGESSESSRLVSTKECEICIEVLRIGKLL